MTSATDLAVATLKVVGATAKAAIGAGQGLFYLAMEAKSAQAEVGTYEYYSFYCSDCSWCC